MAPGATKKQSSLSAPATLNVYKKVAIIRGSEDVLTYEDSAGNFKSVTDLHLAAVATVSRALDDLEYPMFVISAATALWINSDIKECVFCFPSTGIV